NGVGRQAAHIGHDVGAFFGGAHTGEVHLGAGGVGLRVGQESVQIGEGPDLTFGLLLEQDVRIGVVGGVGLGAIDQIVEVRTHLVGLALAEAVAGLALACGSFAALCGGARHQKGNLCVFFGLAIVFGGTGLLVGGRSNVFRGREGYGRGGQGLEIGQDVGAFFRRT